MWLLFEDAIWVENWRKRDLKLMLKTMAIIGQKMEYSL